MKTKLILLVSIFIVVGLLIQPGCKTAEEWMFNMAGAWTFDFTAPTLSPNNWTNILTFTGSTSSGSVTGNIRDYVGETGSYSVSGGTVTITWNFTCVCSAAVIWTINGTGTEANPNFLSGSGSWYHEPTTHNFTFSAIRF